ncbi:MAG: glycosyltransferase [Patescibacteria group bacterium]
MKVLLITNDPTILRTGSSGHVHAKENALAIGELHVLLEGSQDAYYDEGSLRIHVVKRARFFPYASIRKAATTISKQCGIQALWAQDPFELGEVVSGVAQDTGLPFYVNVYTDFLSPWYSTLTGMLRSSKVSVPSGNHARIKLAGNVLPKAAGIRVMSERSKVSLISKFGAAIPEPQVIPVQVHLAAPPPAPFPFTFPFTLVAVGRLDAGRRVIDIIDALAILSDRYPGAGLFIVGDGPERAHLEHCVRRKKLTERVVFLGDRPDAWGLIQSANVFIQASAHEGYGRRILQAALARVPVITTDVGIVGEAFVGYEDVLAMPPGDPATLATHIIGLMEDGQARELLSMSAEASAKRFLLKSGNIPLRLAAFLRGETLPPAV